MPVNRDRSDGLTIQQVLAGFRQLDHRLDPIRLPVIGNSMAPMLKDRDILVVAFDPIIKLTCGDVIVWGKHELITHRVIITRHNRVYTKGDARFWIDPVIDCKEVMGIVKGVDRNGLIADMESSRWKVINRLIGAIGWAEVCLTWRRQANTNKRNGGFLVDRLSFWVVKRLNWVILFLLAGKWMFQKSLRMDERC